MKCVNVKWNGSWQECWTNDGDEGTSLVVTIDGKGEGLIRSNAALIPGVRVLRAWPDGFRLSSFVASDGRFFLGSLRDIPHALVGQSQAAPGPGLGFLAQEEALSGMKDPVERREMVALLADLDEVMAQQLRGRRRLTPTLRRSILDGYAVHAFMTGITKDGIAGAYDDWITPYEAQSMSWVGKAKGPLARVTGVEVLSRYDPTLTGGAAAAVGGGCGGETEE